jgi:alpha-ketoglutarate-dependent taurine dioxygenase
VQSPDDLLSAPVRAGELRHRAVLVKSPAVSDRETLEAVRTALPWMTVWRDHRSYTTGVWRCEVDGALERPDYTAYRPRTLDFHTDMSRYLRPPEFTVIRCVVPDAEGGDNLVLHIDDILTRLRGLGRDDIVDMLVAERPLSMEPRHYNHGRVAVGAPVTAALVVPEAADAPCRIYDRHGASKGDHLALSQEEERLFDEFFAYCRGQEDLAERVRLEAGDILVFSNWRFMHARLECSGSGRVTEICMGNDDRLPTEGDSA